MTTVKSVNLTSTRESIDLEGRKLNRSWMTPLNHMKAEARSVRCWEIAEDKFLVGDLLALWSKNHHS